MEGVALETLNACNARQLGPVQRAVGHRHKAGPHSVAAIGGDDPARALLIPGHGCDLGLETGIGVEVVLFGYGAAMGQNLRRACIFLCRHEADLFQQRQVDIALDVAGCAGIAVPVPGAAEVTALFDDPDVLDARFPQPRPGQQATKPAAHNYHLDLVGQRCAVEPWSHIGVIQIVGILPGYLLVLLVTISPHPLVALGAIARPKRRRIKSQVLRHRLSSVSHGVGLPDRRHRLRRYISDKLPSDAGDGKRGMRAGSGRREIGAA